MEEKKIPYEESKLKAALTYEEFAIITWGLTPVDGVYHIRESLAKYYGILLK